MGGGAEGAEHPPLYGSYGLVWPLSLYPLSKFLATPYTAGVALRELNLEYGPLVGPW